MIDNAIFNHCINILQENYQASIESLICIAIPFSYCYFWIIQTIVHTFPSSKALMTRWLYNRLTFKWNWYISIDYNFYFVFVWWTELYESNMYWRRFYENFKCVENKNFNHVRELNSMNLVCYHWNEIIFGVSFSITEWIRFIVVYYFNER